MDGLSPAWAHASVMNDCSHVTDLLLDGRSGNRAALDRLFAIVYDELRRMAHRQLSMEAAGHTLATTGLVHEVYLRLVDSTRVAGIDRAHFLALAARAMRHVLVDHARRHRAQRRGGDLQRVPLDEALEVADTRAETLLALDQALERLSRVDERLSTVVEFRFFGGLGEEETAEALGVTPRTVRRGWAKAKAWLYEELAGESR